MCNSSEGTNPQLRQKLACVEQDLVDIAQRILKNAGDPFSAIVRFLHERPESDSLPGYLMKTVLAETFSEKEQVPALIKVLAGHVKEIIRYSNVINIINEHPVTEPWGPYLIKKTSSICFEVGKEKGHLVLKNIKGLICVEHGIEVVLDKILVVPPRLECSLHLGIVPMKRLVDIV